MKTYLAKLVFQVNRSGYTGAPEFEEQYWSVPAADENLAFEAARGIGRREEGTVQGPDQSSISWTFVDVSEILAPADGRFAQLQFTRNAQTECAESYVRHIRAKAMHLQVKNLTFA